VKPKERGVTKRALWDKSVGEISQFPLRLIIDKSSRRQPQNRVSDDPPEPVVEGTHTRDGISNVIKSQQYAIRSLGHRGDITPRSEPRAISVSGNDYTGIREIDRQGSPALKL
jgi:hypothetical protein